jgi:hypothetical protein
MMRMNGSSASKSSRSVIVVVVMGPVYVHACAVRRANSANLVGGAPVTFSTLSLGHYGGDGLCQHPQHLAVLGGHADNFDNLDTACWHARP